MKQPYRKRTPRRIPPPPAVVSEDGISRATYHLQGEQITRLQQLPTAQWATGVAFRFWRELCGELGLDVKSVITLPGYRFTALPLNHGKHWCWPYPLKCTRAASEVTI